MSAKQKSKARTRRPARFTSESDPRKKKKARRDSTSSSNTPSLGWIRDLAAPYLRDYSPVAAHEDGLEGFWFVAEPEAQSSRARAEPSSHGRVGFFVGYITRAEDSYSFLKPEPPECAVFAWVSFANRALHERLVREQGSLVRKTFEYIRWLTHRPPRFVFHEAEAAAMARHISMKDWPPTKREHLSRNFFIETLAWLVRSGLVRKLREEAILAPMDRKAT